MELVKNVVHISQCLKVSYDKSMNIVKRQIKRVGIAIVGGLVLILGLVTIPYPGPGWLIVFAGLAILATEFEWAKHVLHEAREKYDMWQRWVKHQPIVVRLLIFALTGLIIVVTMWLLNLFALLDSIFHLRLSWLHSPLSFFSN